MRDVFVVEDSKFDRAKIKEVLDDLEYQTEYFSEAEKVLKILRDKKENDLPELLIVDIVLAGKLSGYQLAEKIKNNCGEIPIIFLTGDSADKDKTAQQLLRGDLYLNKPVNQNELKNNIKIIMEKASLDNFIEKRMNKNIVKNLEHQIWYYKDPYTYKMVNQSYAEFLGKNKEEFSNEYIYNIFPPKDAEKIISENIEIFLQKKTFKRERWYKNSNGENRLLSVKKTPIFNNKGDVENILCQAEDITDQNILENELRRNRDNLQRIIEAVPDMIFLINVEGDILDLWTGDESKLLYPKKEALTKNIKEFLSEEAYNICQQKITELFNQKEAATFEYSLIISEKKKYYEAKMINLSSNDHNAHKQKIIVSVRDITERKESSIKLENLSREYETILSNVENAIFLINVKNNDLRFQRLNSFHEEATGLKTEEIKGKTPVEAFGKEFGQRLERNYRRCLEKKESISYEEKLNLPAGKRIWLTKLAPVINDNGEVEKIVGSSLDITENKIKEQKIEYLSFHDKMTGLYNRRYFENEMQRLDSSRKLPVTVMIADLDDLKYINDNFGHHEGDKYITTAAQMVKESIRSEDIAARIGGDEFAIILPQTDLNGGQKIYQRIKEKESKDLREENTIDTFSISIEYAVKDKKDLNLEEVYKKADQKMYANKAENKKNSDFNIKK